MAKHLFGPLHIREEDYWLHFITTWTVLFLGCAVYASTMPFKLPTSILGLLGLAFTSWKFKSGYGARRAWIHAALTVAMSLLLALIAHFITN